MEDKKESRKRRLDVSVASESQQLNEQQQQQNKRIRCSSEKNQQKSNKDYATASEGTKESNPVSTGANASGRSSEDTELMESHHVSENDERGDSHIRPEGVANLGYFEQGIDGRVTTQNADKAKIQANTTDCSGKMNKVSNDILPEYFSWKSDEGQDIRVRSGFILSVVRSEQVQEMKRALQYLDFEITDWTLNSQSIEFYNTKVSELEPDVGCILTCISGPVCENEQKEVCVRVQEGRDIPITNILHSLVGPNNKKLTGKPKILFVVDMETPQTDSTYVVLKDLKISATNHSGWLVLILKNEDVLEELIELLGNIGEKSLQELLESLLTRESDREDAVLLNSTLQYLIKFPIWPRTFVTPDFKYKKTKISHDQMDSSKSSTESSNEENINFDTLLEKVKQSFAEIKKSIASQHQNMTCLEYPQISNDVESLIKSNPISIRHDEAISAERDSANVSNIWILCSVAGAGKSTVLKEMAHQLTKLDGGFKILLIPLIKYYRCLYDIPAFKVNEIGFLAKTTCNSHEDIINWIKKGELIVFLDGFDEVCPDFREKIIKILIALNNARVPIIVGTRPHEVHHIQDRIKNPTIVEIEPLDEAKQIDLLQIISQKQQQDIESSRKKFKDQDILGNPLYLKLWAESSGDGNLYKIFDKIVRRKVEICLVREIGCKDVGEKMVDKSLKIIQLVAFRFVRGAKIEHGSVTKEELEKINAVGVVTYYNDRLNFTHQTFAEFLTAQKFLFDLKNPGPEKVLLFNDELLQCRKFVDLFFSTEIDKDESYAEAFIDHCANPTNPLKLVQQICQEGLRQMFKLLNQDLSQKDDNGKNALHFALRHLEMVKVVHEKNSDLATETTKNGENCLHLAIADEKCSEEVAIWLLRKTEVDKNAETSLGDTPLLLACEKQKWKVAQQLLCYSDVKVNKSSRDGKSILHHAVLSNNIDLVQGLLDKGSNIQLKDDSGATALHIAARWNENPEIVKRLIDNGAKVNAIDNEQRTALHYAAENNPVPEMILKLIEKGVKVHSEDTKKIKAFHLASGWNKNPAILDILLEDANVNAEDNEKRTALHFAARFNPEVEVLKKLLDKRADVRLKDHKGASALHLAAGWNKNPEIVKLLIDNGAKVNAIDNEQRTALHYAAENNSVPEIIQKLFDYKANVHLDQGKKRIRALDLAAESNTNPEIVDILIKIGAKVDKQGYKKWTALHFAANSNPNPEVVQKLLDKLDKTKINYETSFGETALFLAAKNSKVKEVVVQKLLDHGAKVNEMIRNDEDCVAVIRQINPAIL